jgi:hypothetical protein
MKALTRALGDDYLTRSWRDTRMNLCGYSARRFERAEDLVVRADFRKAGPEGDHNIDHAHAAVPRGRDYPICCGEQTVLIDRVALYNLSLEIHHQ